MYAWCGCVARALLGGQLLIFPRTLLPPPPPPPSPLTQLVVAGGQAAHVQRVVNVLAAGRVHAAHRQVAQVRPAGARRGHGEWRATPRLGT